VLINVARGAQRLERQSEPLQLGGKKSSVRSSATCARLCGVVRPGAPTLTLAAQSVSGGPAAQFKAQQGPTRCRPQRHQGVAPPMPKAWAPSALGFQGLKP